MLISIGAFLGGLAFLMGVAIFAWTVFAGRRVSEPNCWGAGATTLEWTVATPPPYHTFETLPYVR